MTKRIDRPPKKTGRPSGYRPEYARMARMLAQAGSECTDAQLAEFFGVSTKNIYHWRRTHPEFFTAIKEAKELRDADVVNSMFRRALGYTMRVQKVVQENGKHKVVSYLQHVLPNVTAQIFWLKNRQPHLWRDVTQYEVGKPGEFAGLSDAELLNEIREEVEVLGLLEGPTGNGAEPD